MIKAYYENSKGEILNLLSYPFLTAEADWFDAEWEDDVGGFIRTVQLDVFGKNEEDVSQNMEQLYRVLGADAEAGKFGKGLSWRGRLAKKIIEPPVGSDYKTVSGELHTVMKELIEPEFDGLFVVSQEDTGVTVSNYQFDRYCTLYDGIVKMLKSKGYRLQLSFRREQNELGYLYIEAVPIVDYSNRVELSKDCKLNYMFLEAAEIDGANSIQKFFKITLPLMSRNMLFVVIMTCISYFQVFAQVQIMTQGGPENHTNVIGLNIYNYAFRYSQMGYASAMAVVLLGIILIVSLVQLKVGKQDWEY